MNLDSFRNNPFGWTMAIVMILGLGLDPRAGILSAAVVAVFVYMLTKE